MSGLLIHELSLGARPVKRRLLQECFVFLSIEVCHCRFVHGVELRVCMRQLAVLGERHKVTSSLKCSEAPVVWIKKGILAVFAFVSAAEKTF